MDIHTQLKIVRRWLPVLILSVVAAGGLAFAYSSVQDKVYEARTLLIVGQSLSGVNPQYNELLVSQRLSATYAAIATQHEIMAGVVKDVGLSDSPEVLATRISVAASADTALLTITARDRTAEGAAKVANAVAAGLIQASPAVGGAEMALGKSLEQDIASVRADIASTQDQIQTLSAKPDRTPAEEGQLQTLEGRLVSLHSTYAALLSFVSSQAANLLTVVQPALPPSSPIAPRPLFNAALAAILALMVVSALAFMIEYLDDAVKDPERVTETLGLPTLGIVERMRGGGDRRPFYRLAALLYPLSRAAEAYRTVRANLEFAAVDRPIRSLLIASAVPGEGKTVTAANLALVAAQSGRRVLLVDADLRRPGIHDIFGLPQGRGLTDLIRDPSLVPGNLFQTTEQENLFILTSGPLPPNPTELLASQRTKILFMALAGAHDLLILDSPPVQLFTDAPVISSYVDGTLMVVEARRGRRTQLRHAHEALERAGATVLGVVLNRTAPERHPEYARYYDDTDTATTVAAGAPSVIASSEAATPTSDVRRGSESRRDGAPSSIEPR